MESPAIKVLEPAHTSSVYEICVAAHEVYVAAHGAMTRRKSRACLGLSFKAFGNSMKKKKVLLDWLYGSDIVVFTFIRGL